MLNLANILVTAFKNCFQERTIVVREPNGVLRTANKFEKHRMTQIFFPLPGREMHTPKMFEPLYLEVS